MQKVQQKEPQIRQLTRTFPWQKVHSWAGKKKERIKIGANSTEEKNEST